MKKLVLDFDNSIVNTTKAMIRSMNPYIKDVTQKVDENTLSYCWSFADIFPSTHLRYIDILFNSKQLFDNMELFPNVFNVLKDLHEKGVKIYVCTIGSYKNIKLKLDWLHENLPFVDVIPIAQNDIVMNKAIINMENCVFMDDNCSCLNSSNADVKIVYKHDNFTTEKNRVWNGFVGTSWEDEDFIKLLYNLLEVNN